MSLSMQTLEAALDAIAQMANEAAQPAGSFHLEFAVCSAPSRIRTENDSDTEEYDSDFEDIETIHRRAVSPLLFPNSDCR